MDELQALYWQLRHEIADALGQRAARSMKLRVARHYGDPVDPYTPGPEWSAFIVDGTTSATLEVNSQSRAGLIQKTAEEIRRKFVRSTSNGTPQG